jgi:hypothetical protein
METTGISSSHWPPDPCHKALVFRPVLQIPRGSEKTGARLHGAFGRPAASVPSFPRSSRAQRSYGFDRAQPPLGDTSFKYSIVADLSFLFGDSKGDVHCPG